MSKPAKSNDEPAQKSGGGMLGMIALVAASLGSAFGVTYMLAPDAGPVDEAACNSDAGAALTDIHAKPMMVAGRTYVALPEVLITIGSAPATRYLKMGLTVTTTKGGEKSVEEAAPVLMDAFNNYLRSIELTDFEDPAFYSRMREQLTRRAELVLGADASASILITEFLLR